MSQKVKSRIGRSNHVIFTFSDFDLIQFQYMSDVDMRFTLASIIAIVLLVLKIIRYTKD